MCVLCFTSYLYANIKGTLSGVCVFGVCVEEKKEEEGVATAEEQGR